VLLSMLLKNLNQLGCLGGSPVICQGAVWLAAPHLRQPGMGRDLATAAQVLEWLVPISLSCLKEINYTSRN
jgi:hypothetical protein